MEKKRRRGWSSNWVQDPDQLSTATPLMKGTHMKWKYEADSNKEREEEREYVWDYERCVGENRKKKKKKLEIKCNRAKDWFWFLKKPGKEVGAFSGGHYCSLVEFFGFSAFLFYILVHLLLRCLSVWLFIFSNLPHFDLILFCNVWGKFYVAWNFFKKIDFGWCNLFWTIYLFLLILYYYYYYWYY